MKNKKGDFSPPKYAKLFLQWFLKDQLAEEVIGDLEEQFLSKQQKDSKLKTNINYWWQVISYLRPFAIKNIRSNSIYFTMYRHHFKIAWRTILKDKISFLINTIGLALSMFCAMLIILWVNDELNYDAFYPDAKKIYRVYQGAEYDSGEVFKATATPAPLAPEIQANIAGILNFTRFRPTNDKSLISKDESQYYENVTYVDSTFFEVFQLPFIVGNEKNALDDPNSIILTEKLAIQYFGNNWKDEDVLGSTLLINEKEEVKITGVIENLPSNAHFKFSLLLPFSKLRQYGWNLGWGNNFYYAYFILEDGYSPSTVSDQITQLGKDRGNLPGELGLQALTDIHLHSDFDIDVYGSSEPLVHYVTIFIAVAIAIIIIACINFMNLSTARSEKRAKEIGLRKAVGSRRGQIIEQLLSEAVMVTMLALLIAIAATILFLPFFNNLADKSIILDMQKWPILLGFFIGAIVVGLLAGSYPAFYLSAFKPAQVLKGNTKIKGGKAGFRKILVTVQFTVSIALLIGAVVVYSQFRYFLEKDLGYDKEHIVYLPVHGNIIQQYDGFKNNLLREASIESITISSDVPTYTVHATTGFRWEGKNEEDNILMHHYSIDYDFIETMGLEVIEGRGFSKDFPSDSSNYILNEEALRLTGLENPIGQSFSMWGREGKIVGIVKDFNFKSFHQKVEPLVMRTVPAWNNYLFVKIGPGDVEKSLALIQDNWQRVNPGFPMEYYFLDDQYKNLYKSEKKMAKVFEYFTFFTLFIACLGLIGLINFMLEKRRKEISIRKVFGASVGRILVILAKEYFLLVMISIVIAIPFAGFLMLNWLENYAYQIQIQWWMFAIPGLVVLSITMLLVSGQTTNAAKQNPVKNLRHE